MVIDGNTKISALIRENPAVVDVIASINHHFRKLQNPLLRKILASRVTIAEAAKIGGCDISTFFDRLTPFGFQPATNTPKQSDQNSVLTQDISSDITLDVRADLKQGLDPFLKIMDSVRQLKHGRTLLLVNSFEPVPLIRILNERGYETSVQIVQQELVHTYIKKKAEGLELAAKEECDQAEFTRILDKFKDKLKPINVRTLPMPQPMTTILKELESLPKETALFVYHKKVPLFLLPELATRSFEAVFRSTIEGVELIIYKAD